MLIPFGLAAVIAAAISLLVLASIGFGHRYSDMSSKFHDKPKTDELNDVTLAIRDEDTMPTIEKLWDFLSKTNGEMRRVGAIMVVKDLLYDINRRKELIKLINELAQTFRNETAIRDSWECVRRHYGRLGRSMYGLAAAAGAGGYPLLIFSSTSFSDTFPTQTSWLWGAPIIIGTLIFLNCFYVRNQLSPCLERYQNAVKKYLIDAVHI